MGDFDLHSSGAASDSNVIDGLGRQAGYPYRQRVMCKGQEARAALAHILAALDSGVSLGELERALTAIKSHIGFGDPK